MKLGAKDEIGIPEGVELKLDGKTIEVSGPKGRLKRTFDVSNVKTRVEGRRVLIETESMRRRDKAMAGTIEAHLRNMLKGVTKGFTYKLRVVYSHFPVSIKVDGKRVLIQNFLGERSPRVAEIVRDVNVEVKGEEIIVNGVDKDDVGQTAFNIEQATFVKHRDLRTFQDGCYIVERE